MDKRRRWTNRLCTFLIMLAVLILGLPVYGFVSAMMRYVFHLELSQDYRKVEVADQLRFWEGWSRKVYIRYSLGLRPIDKREDVPEEEKPTLSWLETDVYDITAAGDQAAWYDWKEDKIFLGNVEGEIQDSFDVLYTVEELAFSPDSKYLLVYEIEYGVYGGQEFDEEYCYYRVIDLEDGTQHTVYSGYRQWFFVYWEKEC